MIFDDSGMLKAVGVREVGAAKAIEQICFGLYKLETDYSPKQVAGKVQEWRDIQDSIALLDYDTNDRAVKVRDSAANLIGDMIGSVDLSLVECKFGPGSTAQGRMSLNQKFGMLLNSSTPEGYPKELYGSFTRVDIDDAEFVSEETRRCTIRESGAEWGSESITVPVKVRAQVGFTVYGYERVSKMCAVPKDVRGPRLIMSEPNTSMWVQQGQRRLLERAIYQGTSGRINFRDQRINANLALAASRTGEYATLDMSNASDRVSVKLVSDLFCMCPKVLPYLMASRSKHADLDGVITPEMEAIYALPRGKHVLRSFAPMGSAVCFPVESVIFWALAVSSIWNSENTLDCEGRRLIEESVYVFGDDIIIPTKYAQQVMDDLTLFGLKFGPEKCFTKGPFRESCGCNAFDGERIEPVMIKKALPLALEDVERLAAWFDYDRQFAYRWMWKTCAWIEQQIIPLFREDSVPLGYATDTPILHLFSFSTYSTMLLAPLGTGEFDVTSFEQRIAWTRPDLPSYQRRVVRANGFVSTISAGAGRDETAALFEWLSMRKVVPPGFTQGVPANRVLDGVCGEHVYRSSRGFATVELRRTNWGVETDWAIANLTRLGSGYEIRHPRHPHDQGGTDKSPWSDLINRLTNRRLSHDRT
jgi:hypothetical protein